MSSEPRHLDHLVLAVRDLDAAAATYARMGFLVGDRNSHPWGTANRVVQLGSSYLELITVADADRIPHHAPGSFSFGRFVQDFLSRREGLAMLVLDSVDAVADAAAFARHGIGDLQPFFFERSARAADGTETHLAFTLAFAVDPAPPDAGFIVCQHHRPEAFWTRAKDHLDFLRAFTGAPPLGDGLRYRRDHGGLLRLEERPGSQASSGSSGFTGFTVRVPDPSAVAARLSAADLPFERLAEAVSPPGGRGASGARGRPRPARARCRWWPRVR